MRLNILQRDFLVEKNGGVQRKFNGFFLTLRIISEDIMVRKLHFKGWKIK